MTRRCNTANADAAKNRAASILKDAAGRISSDSGCQAKLMAAQIAFDGAHKFADGLERRNEYIRATFHAGQALTCAIVSGIIIPETKKRKRSKSKDKLPANTRAPKTAKKRVRHG